MAEHRPSLTDYAKLASVVQSELQTLLDEKKCDIDEIVKKLSEIHAQASEERKAHRRARLNAVANVDGTKFRVVNDAECFERQAKLFASKDLEHLQRALIAESKKGPYSDLIEISHGYRTQLERLRKKFPNFRECINEIEEQLAIAEHTDLVFRIPTPVLLVGPPGIGKTAFMNAFSRALEIKYHRFVCSDQNASFALTGLTSSYSSALPGDIYRWVIEKRCANPIFLLDEIDKSSKNGVKDAVENAFFTLLEPESAKHYRDACMQIEFDASNISFIATANDLNEISEPILNRFRIIHINEPSFEQRIAICRGIYSDVLREKKLQSKFKPELDQCVIDLLVPCDGSVRDIRRKIYSAIGRSLLAGRPAPRKRFVITEKHIDLPKPTDGTKRIGFIHGR